MKNKKNKISFQGQGSVVETVTNNVGNSKFKGEAKRLDGKAINEAQLQKLNVKKFFLNLKNRRLRRIMLN